MVCEIAWNSFRRSTEMEWPKSRSYKQPPHYDIKQWMAATMSAPSDSSSSSSPASGAPPPAFPVSSYYKYALNRRAFHLAPLMPGSIARGTIRDEEIDIQTDEAYKKAVKAAPDPSKSCCIIA